MRMNAQIVGLAKLTANIALREKRLNAAAKKGLNDVAIDVFNESQRRVPVDTGNLKGSGRLDPAE